VEVCRCFDEDREICSNPDAAVRIKKINWMMGLQVAASWGERMALEEKIRIEEANVGAIPSAGKLNYFSCYTKCTSSESEMRLCSHYEPPARNLAGVVVNFFRDIRI
jgi:hypothetical protein